MTAEVKVVVTDGFPFRVVFSFWYPQGSQCAEYNMDINFLLFEATLG